MSENPSRTEFREEGPSRESTGAPFEGEQELESAFSAFQSRHFYHAFTEMLPTYLFAKDRSGRYVYVNDAFVSICNGRSREQIIGKRARSVFDSKRAERAEKEDEQIMKTGIPILNRVNRDTTAGGEDRFVMVSKVPVRNERGDIMGLAGMLFDITERKRNEERLAELFEEVEKRNAELEADLLLAKEVQKAFMNAEASGVRNSSIEIAQQYHASNSIGGDLLIVGHPLEHVWTLFLCDVMGHGVRAALITGLLRGLYDQLRDQLTAPAHFLTELNHRYTAMLKTMDAPIFVTVSVAVFDCERNQLTLANAGHHDPICYRLNESACFSSECSLSNQEPAIGLLRDFNYTEVEHAFASDDSFLFYTDGIWDANHAPQTRCELEHLTSLFRNSAHQSAKEIVSSLFDPILRNTPILPDDICAVVVKIRGAS